ncbi:TetR/AcrR family transcriptional regulator [Anaerosporobacter sp.]
MDDQNKITDAQRALWDGLGALWHQKSIYQIGIKELCQASHVARSTFYVYYQNIDELAEEMETFHMRKLIEMNQEVPYVSEECNSYDFYHNTLTYIEANKQIFYAWLIAFPNNRFINKWKQATKKHLLKRIGNGHKIPNQDLILEMIASEVIAAYTYWLQNPYEIDVHKMDEVVGSTLKFIK